MAAPAAIVEALPGSVLVVNVTVPTSIVSVGCDDERIIVYADNAFTAASPAAASSSSEAPFTSGESPRSRLANVRVEPLAG